MYRNPPRAFIVASLLLIATIAPGLAYNLISEEDKSLDIYGSVRGYAGFGGYSDNAKNVADIDGNARSYATSYGSALYGVQSNSYLGVRGQFGNVKAQAEMGYAGSDGLGGFRLLWGSYDFGKAGSLLFGKHNTPSVAKSIFASNVLDTDQGQRGFGAISTANYKFQFAYSIAGLTLAIVDDYTGIDNSGNPPSSMQNELIPRISASYYVQEDGLDMQVGGSYKYYNRGVRSGYVGAGALDGFQGDGRYRFASGSGHAFHIFAAIRSKLLENRLYVSTMAHYGMNADLYDEQRTGANLGMFAHSSVFVFDEKDSDTPGNDNVHRVGGYLESGYALSDKISGVLGFGYQYSAKSNTSLQRVLADTQSFLVSFQLPIILDRGFIITPHIGYYGALIGTFATEDAITSTQYLASLIALAQLRYNF